MWLGGGGCVLESKPKLRFRLGCDTLYFHIDKPNFILTSNNSIISELSESYESLSIRFNLHTNGLKMHWAW